MSGRGGGAPPGAAPGAAEAEAARVAAALRLVQRDPFALRDCGMHAHAGVVRAAVALDGWALQFAAPELRDDEEVVLAAVQRTGLALQFASKRLRDSLRVAVAATASFGWALQFASARLRDMYEVVLLAVEYDGFSLQFASRRLRGDRRVVRAAVRDNDGVPLREASDELRGDQAFVLELMQIERCAVFFALPALLEDRGFVLEAVRRGYGCAFAAPELLSAESFAREAIAIDPNVLRDLGEAALGDAWRACVEDAVGRDGLALHFAGSLRDDEAVVERAVGNSWAAIRFASERLRRDDAFISRVGATNPELGALARETLLSPLLTVPDADADASAARLAGEGSVTLADEDEDEDEDGDEDEDDVCSSYPSTIRSLRLRLRRAGLYPAWNSAGEGSSADETLATEGTFCSSQPSPSSSSSSSSSSRASKSQTTMLQEEAGEGDGECSALTWSRSGASSRDGPRSRPSGSRAAHCTGP